MTSPAGKPRPDPHLTAVIAARRRLAAGAFELRLSRPNGFDYQAGQRIRIADGTFERDYTIAGAPREPWLTLCIRHIPEGPVSSRLASAPMGSEIRFSGPHGYFVFQPSDAAPVFVATGTGIAPFRAMAASGITGFTLFHGVRTAAELFYEAEMRRAAARYVPCLSEAGGGRVDGGRVGRVTQAVGECLPPGAYDFYLCGRREMVRDMTFLVDDRFPGARLYTEIFF